MSTPNARHNADIRTAGPHIIVRMTANNALHAAGLFAIFDPSGTNMLEQWSMAVDVTGQVNHPVGTPNAQLCDGFLTWRILVCSHDPNIDSGVVEVTVRQNGVACSMTPSARYVLGPSAGHPVPHCEGGSVIPITDDLRFACA